MSYFGKLLNINIFIFILQFLKNMDNFSLGNNLKIHIFIILEK